MERQSISLIVFSVFFGVLVGGVALLSAFYAQGNFASNAEHDSLPVSGMDILNEYKCRKTETKEIILGGVEDYFDPLDIEASNPNEKLLSFLQRSGGGGGAGTKNYDERTLDSAVSDQFDISKRTFHGILTIRIEELSSLKNDSIEFGYNRSKDYPYVDPALGYTDSVSNLNSRQVWKQYNKLYVASLEELKVSKPSGEFTTVLDVIRSQTDEFFIALVTDDTVVDFIGFAICLEPAEHRGMVISEVEYIEDFEYPKLGEGIFSISPAEIGGKICSNGGCLSCEQRRPVSCIKDKNLQIPGKNYPEDYKRFWSGGEITFTRPVKGSLFDTADDVDKFCTKELGDQWRALSYHDGGWGGMIIGKGEFPSEYENAWINLKDSPHANCWKLRLDYESLND